MPLRRQHLIQFLNHQQAWLLLGHLDSQLVLLNHQARRSMANRHRCIQMVREGYQLDILEAIPIILLTLVCHPVIQLHHLSNHNHHRSLLLGHIRLLILHILNISNICNNNRCGEVPIRHQDLVNCLHKRLDMHIRHEFLRHKVLRTNRVHRHPEPAR